MKKLIVLAVVVVGFVGLARPGQAAYRDPITHEAITTYYSHCALTPDPAEKNATTVYTLNIAKTKQVEDAYMKWWNRAPRCDELQYHAEHGTSIDKLNGWLYKTEVQRYRDHYYTGGIIKTHDLGTFNNAKLWRIINGRRQRVYDWPTQMAWGYLIHDVRQLPLELIGDFLSAYPEISALKYADAPYKTQVDALWRTGSTDISVPAPLKTELIQYGVNSGLFKYRDACSQYFTRGCPSGYDWTYLLALPCRYGWPNPICD